MAALQERERAVEREATVKKEEEIANWQEFDATANAKSAQFRKPSSARPKPKPKPKAKA